MAIITVAKTGGDYTTHQAALAAAANGDTIKCLDSQTYQDGQFIFDGKSNITVQPDTGQTPTLKGTTNEFIDLGGSTTGNILIGYTIDTTGIGSNFSLSFEDFADGNTVRQCTFINAHVKFSESAQNCKVDRCKFTSNSSTQEIVDYHAYGEAGENRFICCEFYGFTNGAIVVANDTPLGVYGCVIDGQDNSATGIVDTGSAGNLTVTNTIVTRCTTQFTSYAGTDKTKVTYTCLEGQSLTGFGTGCTNADPLFVNPSNRRLQASSTLLNAGTNLSAIYTVDLDGDTITGTYEIGAYDGSGGGPSLTYYERTIGTGGDHADVAAFKQWIIDNVHATDLTAADAHVTGIFIDSTTYSAGSTQFTFTSDGDRTIVLRAQSGAAPTLVSNSANGAVYANTNSMQLTGLKFKQTSTSGCRGLRIAGNNIKVSQCLFDGDSQTTGTQECIYVSSGTGVLIERCKLYGSENGLDTVGGTTMRNCVLYALSANAVTIPSGAGNILIEHCTFDPNTGRCYLTASTATTNTLRNCILKVGTTLQCIYVNGTSTVGFVSDYNTYIYGGGSTMAYVNGTTYDALSDWQAAYVNDDNSNTTAPPWTDEAGADYTLTASHDGADYSVGTDYNGNPRANPADKGAFEYQAVPAAPTSGSATPNSSTQITFSWTDNSSNEDGFEVERAPDSGGSPGTWALLTTTAANAVNYVDTGLAAGTTYWYRTRSTNIFGDSAYTSQTSATTQSGAARRKRRALMGYRGL